MSDLPHTASTRFHYAMLLLAALASITAAIYSATTASTLRESITMVTHTLNVQRNIDELLAENQDVETQALRYMVSQRPDFLLDYQRATRKLDAQLAVLAAMLMDNPEQLNTHRILSKAINERNIWFEEGIRVAEQGPIQAVSARVREGYGATALEHIRVIALGMAEEEARLLIGRQQQLDRTIVQSTTTSLLVNLLALIVGGIALVSLRRGARAMEQRRIALLEANQASRESEAKSAFLASMSHEIRTPMNAVFGFSQLLAKTRIEPQAREYIKAIQTSGRALLALINDILDLSKIEAGKLPLSTQPTDIRELVDSTLGVFAETASSKGLTLHSHTAPSVPVHLVVDPHRLRQVLMNIVSNAVKYTDAGEVNICVSSSPLSADQRCDLSIDVKDTGIGISPAQQGNLFEPFFRAVDDGDEREGTGLGLAIVRRLLGLMNGSIHLTSSLGAGSTFCIELRDVEVSQDGPSPLDEQSTHADFSRLVPSRVLIVDDVAWNRDLLAAFLAEGDHQLAFASDGEQALQEAKLHRPDVVLMDLRMPRLGGREAARRLRGMPDFKALKIIAISASSMSREEHDIGFDFDAYIRKPVSREVLFQALADHVGLIEQADDTSGEPAAADVKGDLIDAQERLRVIQRLKDIVGDELAAAQATLRVVEVRKLGEELASLGFRGGLPTVSYFAQRLLSAVDRFDVMQMESLLRQLADYVAAAEQGD